MSTVHVEGLGSAPAEVYSTALMAGDYDVMVQASDIITSQAKGSQGLKLELIVEEGPIQVIEEQEFSPIGRHLFDTQWLPHSGQKDGGNFCKSHMAKIRQVLGLAPSDEIDTAEYIGCRARVRVIKVTKDQDGNDLNEPRNEITRWYAL